MVGNSSLVNSQASLGADEGNKICPETTVVGIGGRLEKQTPCVDTHSGGEMAESNMSE